MKKSLIWLMAILLLLPCLTAMAETVPPPCELPENAARYATYAEAHAEMEWAEVLLHVNLRLDYPNYQGILYAQRPDSFAVFVNKHYKLPKSYKPEDLVTVAGKYSSKTVQLRAVCYEAFLCMAEDARAQGLDLYISSGYRVNKKSGGADSLWFAWPGHSEHQTGLAFDLRTRGPTKAHLGDYKYQNTREYSWLCENAHLYGFINSYPTDSSGLTGFGFEPWHWRYVGVTIATDMKNKGFATYHEYWATYLILRAWYAEEEVAPSRPHRPLVRRRVQPELLY
ncbi:MAG: M15 family metallopeptidase [Clostridiales bacterium]|nr:M15 family metallopeptidase [Clostridiales bacterium]